MNVKHKKNRHCEAQRAAAIHGSPHPLRGLVMNLSLKKGLHFFEMRCLSWVPALAGMTNLGLLGVHTLALSSPFTSPRLVIPAKAGTQDYYLFRRNSSFSFKQLVSLLLTSPTPPGWRVARDDGLCEVVTL